MNAGEKASAVGQKLKKSGPFKIKKSDPVRLSALILGKATEAEQKMAEQVLKAMQSWLKRQKVPLAAGGLDIIPAGSSPEELSTIMRKQKFGSEDAVLIFGTKTVQRMSSELYDLAKFNCLMTGASSQAPRHTASQWFDLTKADLWNEASGSFRFAIDVCGAGMLAKLGHVPWALDPSPWMSAGTARQVAVVGYDVCHMQRKGIYNHIAAGLRVSSEDDSSAMSHVSFTMQRVQAETVQEVALKNMIPEHFARGKVVVIHRDGRFTRDEVSTLKKYQESLENTGFVLLEVVKHADGTPRIYNGDKSPAEGTMMILSESEVILASSKQLWQGTANPLNVRVKETFGDISGFDMENFAWAKTVFDLSYLHHGSLAKRPRLPVTTHFADRLAGIYANAGREHEIQMELTDGSQQFWL